MLSLYISFNNKYDTPKKVFKPLTTHHTICNYNFYTPIKMNQAKIKSN